MTKKELLHELRQLKKDQSDPERNHVEADDLLLAYINDEEITDAFDRLEKFYA